MIKGIFFGVIQMKDCNVGQINFMEMVRRFYLVFILGFYIHIFLPTGSDENYIYSDSNILCFGCSNESFSLYLKDNFLKGYSKKTETFNFSRIFMNIILMQNEKK